MTIKGKVREAIVTALVMEWLKKAGIPVAVVGPILRDNGYGEESEFDGYEIEIGVEVPGLATLREMGGGTMTDELKSIHWYEMRVKELEDELYEARRILGEERGYVGDMRNWPSMGRLIVETHEWMEELEWKAGVIKS